MSVQRATVAAVMLLISLTSVRAGKAQDQSTMTVAVVQLRTSSVGNFDEMQSLAKQAKQQGADLVVFPEGSVFGWLNPDVFTKAAPIPGAYSDKFAAIAKSESIWVAAGLAERGPQAGAGSLPGAYQAYDSAVLINPQGEIVLHHRKYNVLADAFDRAECKRILNLDECSYTAGSLADITTAQTPFGKTSLLVCADAYTYSPALALRALKSLQPTFVIVPWGITASEEKQCGGPYFDATANAVSTANYLKTAYVVGANAVGPRTYGRYLPSVYCGTSGYATPAGVSVEGKPRTAALFVFKISKVFDADAGPVWSNADARQKCPAVCSDYNATWNRQWTTTVPGVMSVCGCLPSADAKK